MFTQRKRTEGQDGACGARIAAVVHNDDGTPMFRTRSRQKMNEMFTES